LVLYFGKGSSRPSSSLSDRLRSDSLKSSVLVIRPRPFIPVVLSIDFGILEGIFLVVFNIKDLCFPLSSTGVQYKFSVIGISGIAFFTGYLKSGLEFFRTFDGFVFVSFGSSALVSLVLTVDLLDKSFLLALILSFWKSLYQYILRI
jgi:hypothetical protein